MVALRGPSVTSVAWLNSHTFRSNTPMLPLAYGITDWLIEPFTRLLDAAIVLCNCFVIDASHPRHREGLRSPMRRDGQRGGILTCRFAKP